MKLSCDCDTQAEKMEEKRLRYSLLLKMQLAYNNQNALG